MKRIAAAAVGLAVLVSATPALADSTAGRVIAYDRVAQRLVMEDQTVFSLGETTQVPEVLSAGDQVRIEFTSPGEDGIGEIVSVTIVDDED